MSHDAVLEDSLREAGFERITAWRLRAVTDFLTTLPMVGEEYQPLLATRLAYDLAAGSLEEFHGEALVALYRARQITTWSDLLAAGHTVHCAWRLVIGDGGCECRASRAVKPATP